MADDVRNERLNRANKMIVDLAPRLDETNFIYVLEQLGLDLYIDRFDSDNPKRWRLRELTNLQTIALAAAMLAFKEYLEDQGWL